MAIRSVWMITFEATPFTKVGGLAEVPTNLSLSLVRKGVHATIIMPSHTTRAENGSEVYREVLNGRSYNFEKISYRGVSFVRIHSDKLDDPRVYAEEVLRDKIIDFSIAFSQLLAKVDEIGVPEPDVLHFHDWHSVLPLLKAKEKREDEKPYLVYHVHLLVKKKLDFSMLEAIGLRGDWLHRAYLNGRTMETTLQDIFNRVNGIAEKLGLAESDQLITVSHSYLEEDLYNNLGEDALKRGAVVYNGTDWSYDTLIREVLAIHGEKIKKFSGEVNGRLSLRRYFLLHAIGDLPEDEPRLPDENIRRFLLDRLAPPFKDNLKVEPFMLDGPLAITTGRLSRQKGFDTLAEATEILLRELGEAKIVFLVLPVWGGEKYSDSLIELSREYPHSVRIIFGAAPSIYKLAHLSADVFAAPSRWEPFGIMAIEALASGCPVVATRVGGLKETILDINKHGIKGTGLHVAPDDPYELADALRDLLAFMEASNRGNLDRYHDKIGNRTLASLLEEYLDAGEIIRKNAIDSVNTKFTWEKATDMLLDAYYKLFKA